MLVAAGSPQIMHYLCMARWQLFPCRLAKAQLRPHLFSSCSGAFEVRCTMEGLLLAYIFVPSNIWEEDTTRGREYACNAFAPALEHQKEFKHAAPDFRGSPMRSGLVKDCCGVLSSHSSVLLQGLIGRFCIVVACWSSLSKISLTSGSSLTCIIP